MKLKTLTTEQREEMKLEIARLQHLLEQDEINEGINDCVIIANMEKNEWALNCYHSGQYDELAAAEEADAEEAAAEDAMLRLRFGIDSDQLEAEEARRINEACEAFDF